jgi:putative membrane protein
MADSERRNETQRFEVKPDAPTHFAWLRTRMSMERTLMSWVRTATGFLGLGLIGTGLVALIISVWEYQSLVRYLWERDFKPVAGVSEFRHHTPVVAVSVVLILIGIFAFVAVLLRVP